MSLTPATWWKPPLGMMLFLVGALLMAGALNYAYVTGYQAAVGQVKEAAGRCWGTQVLPRADSGRVR